MVSRCCKSDIHVTLDHYVCNFCHRPCDGILPVKECINDTRHTEQAQELVNAS